MKANLECRLAFLNHYFILSLTSESPKEKEIIEDFNRKLKEGKIERISTQRISSGKKEYTFLLKVK